MDVELSTRNVLALAAGRDAASLANDTTLQELQIDSIGAAALTMLLEAELEISISQAEVIKFLSLEHVSEFAGAVARLYAALALDDS